jgi:hypothetical protein
MLSVVEVVSRPTWDALRSSSVMSGAVIHAETHLLSEAVEVAKSVACETHEIYLRYRGREIQVA